MPDTEDDLKKLTAGEQTAVVSAWTVLETHVTDAPEDPNFASDLARHLTSYDHRYARGLRSKPHRALSDTEASAYADQIYSRHGARDLRRLISLCWARLPTAASPEIALSFQRLIAHMTTLNAWTQLELGQEHLARLDRIEKARAAREQEAQALARWARSTPAQDPETGKSEP
ncbi:hypothetical protein [Pararhodobacter aggregans]|uniref:hypothetical protein n=1 Tax=Pararhodobacter aggregans TaxID=404875 RepID=UPI003A94FCA7